jgi:hypothetical protein
MTSEGNGPPLCYKVTMSEQTKAKLKQLHQAAMQRGEGQQFLNAFRHIVAQLRDTPLTFGDPLYRLPALRLLVHHGVIAPLVVYYGVHEERPLVFIAGFKMFS